MRVLLAVLALLALATPVHAADWGHYRNERFGYEIDVPPGFEGHGESDNGDGQAFSTPTAQLLVFGSNIVDGRFEDEVAFRQHALEDEGWILTYQAATPRWASLSGVRGARVLYQRLILVCGNAVAGFALTYSRTDLIAFNPIVDRLVRSLMRTTTTCPVG